jgi:hypothetical protein
MRAGDFFARDYAHARQKFLAAAESAGLKVASYRNPANGPAGEALYTDVVRVGPARAERILLFNSATHGVEGFCGSGIQVGWLRSGEWRRLPRGVGAVLVHAINPHGFAWLRRVTEDNVDLNRNFQDFSKPLPVNAAYDELHQAIVPQRWDEASVGLRDQLFADYAKRHGPMALQGAVSGGQYRHADGVFYGGTQPTWSNRTFHEIVGQFLEHARHVAFVDLHTGLGPYGYGELICTAVPGSHEWEELQAWYGEGITSPESGTSRSAPITGFIRTAVVNALPKANVRAITIEYGTYPVREVLATLIADNWLHLRGDPASEYGRAVKVAVRRAFYPDESDWKEMVYLRARQILRRGAAGLAALRKD